MPDPSAVVIADSERLFRKMLTLSIHETLDVQVAGTFASGQDLLRDEAGLAFSVAILNTEFDEGPHGVQTALLLRQRRPQVGILLVSLDEPERWRGMIPYADNFRWIYLQRTDKTDWSTLIAAVRALIFNNHRWSVPIGRGMDDVFGNALTVRQLEFLRLIAWGYSNAEIGRQLRLAPKSVENFITRLYRLLEVPVGDPRVHPRVKVAQLYWDQVWAAQTELPHEIQPSAPTIGR